MTRATRASTGARPPGGASTGARPPGGGSRALVAAALGVGALAAAGCGPARDAAPVTPSAGASPRPTAVAAAGGAVDICAGNPPPPHPFSGLLSRARCDQEMFLTMAGVADQLGVECSHCHAPHPTDKQKEDYPKATPRKEIANWMGNHMMRAVKMADGSPMRCKSCHQDPDTGKSVARFLGNPRDPRKAQEWMTMVMVNRFVGLEGQKLRCKSCHVENFGKSAFQGKVILRTDHLPPPTHPPAPPPAAEPEPPPAVSPDPLAPRP
ncbi:MAG: hypothetical protein WKG00_31645 [Polyangiaceae bacterium]